MLSDITIGQYYSEDSLIHRLDSRVKIRFTLIYILLLLIDRNCILFGMMTAVFIAVCILSKVPFCYMFRGCFGIIVMITLFSMINIFSTPGETIYHIGIVKISIEGIIKFIMVTWRMLLMVFMSSIIMYTTTPSQLTDGLEKCFCLSGNVAMGMTIALRFISILFEELDKIKKAQISRGATIKQKGLKNKLIGLRLIIVPLFQNSINRAANLGEAMDARCYVGGKNRTKLYPLRYDSRDFVAYFFILAMTVAGIIIAIKF